MAKAHVQPATAEDFFVMEHFKNFLTKESTLLKLTDSCSRQSLKAHLHLLHTMLTCLLSIDNIQYFIIKLKTFYCLTKHIFLQSYSLA